MESFNDFMQSFRTWKEKKKNNHLLGTLRRGRSCLQNLSTSDIGLALSDLLNDKTGLLHFLKDPSDKDMKEAIGEGFKLLQFVIEEFFGLLNQYINGIKDVCQSAIIKKCSSHIKVKAVQCFAILLELCPCGKEVKLDETVELFIEKLHLSNDMDRAKFLETLGTVAKYHPQSMTSAHFDTIFERFMNDFDKIFKPEKIRPDLQHRNLGSHLKVLNNFLTNFSRQNTNETSEYYQKVYQCMKNLSKIDLNQRYKYVSREAIELLESHMSLFIDYIYTDAIDDALFWPNILLEWTNLPDLKNRKVAFNACSVYYKTMGTLLKSKNNKSSEIIFQNLMQRFHDDFLIDKINPTNLQLSIYGFGHMAGPCKNYLTEKDVASMFSLIAQRIFVICPSNHETKIYLENIAYYQVTLSQILVQMSDVSMDQLTALSTFSLILIKRFPDLPVTSHQLIVTSLMESFRNISKACSRRMRGEFIQQLVYEGMIWSCSHTLYIDAEREREIKNLDERPICYKNYLRLWQPLLSPNNSICSIKCPEISFEIFKNMIETCVKVIKKLNFNVTTIDTSDEKGAFNIPGNESMNDTDFRVFANLVDLVVAILEELQQDFVESKMNWFLCKMIKKSNKNPLISGFYKMVHVVLKRYNLSPDHGEERLLPDTLRLLSHYLLHTIDRSSNFSGELQASCLTMIFEMPFFIAESLLDRLTSTFKTAFSLGQSNFSLAQSALNALEKWTKKTDEKITKKFLIEVVPSLESYLQSNETDVEFTLPNERKVIKNIILTDHKKTLQEFQRRILIFFGSLNSEITSNFRNQRSIGNTVLSDDQNLLQYTLLYKDIEPRIYLDKILPRTIELALNSTDRRTRVSACEVLHTIITVMLGQKIQLLASNSDHLLPMFKKICPVVLRLGSDSDKVIEQLFHPLMIQLTHWYSSSEMFKTSEADCLIEILFDSMTYESNMALSNFSGICLAEFVEWSSRRSTNLELTHIAAIISKVTYLAVHPSLQKRIGASVAFNYLYKIFSESDVIIETFWLELLVCFIKSLDRCNNVQILNSLKHIEWIIDNKYEILKGQSSRRRKPAEFEGTMLEDAAEWLIVQCGSLDRNCRSKSMELLRVISKHLPALGSIQKIFANYASRKGVRNLNKIILKDLLPKIKALSIETMKPLLRTLDCYIWIIGEESLEFLFTDKNVERKRIFDCVIDFIYLVNEKKEENEQMVKFTRQYQELCVLKCEIISKIFHFMNILLNKLESQTIKSSYPYINSFFRNDELFSLMTKCIFQPEVIGFCLQNLEIIKSLSSSVKQLLNTLILKLDNENFSRLRNSIAKGIESKYEDCFDLNKIFSNDTSIALKSYLKGLSTLKTFQQFGKLYEKPLYNDYDSANKVTEIFNLLKREQNGKVIAVELESSKKEYLENLLEFLCLRFEESMVRTLVNIIESKTELMLQDSTIIFHGEYFVNLFGITVFRNLLKHISKSMNTLLSDSLKEKFDTVLIILEDLLLYVKKNLKISEEYLPDLEIEIVNRFPTLYTLMTHSEKQKSRMINLYSLLIQLSQNPSMILKKPDDLYSWIMQELLGPLDLEYKIRILNSFLPFIVDETVEKKHEIERCLHKLKTDYYPMNMNDLVKGTLKYSTVISSFETLTRHLPILKSVTVFDCVIHLSIGNVEYLWNDNSTKYLIAFFKEVSTNDLQTSLGILFKYFMNTENLKERLAILNKLIRECIHFCNANSIEQFFETNIREIYDTVSQNLLGNISGLQNLMISKIGCYNLLEIMFAKVSLEKITSADNKIVKNAIEGIKTGRELFQALNKNVLNVRKLQSDNTESREVMRLLHCAAYNCSIAIVSLKCEECFNVLPFAENRTESQLVWENIIDGNRRYEFAQDFKEKPKEYKKLINIRKGSELKQAHSQLDVESYNIVASTLNKDLRRLDSYESNFSSQSIPEIIDNEEMISLTFESDDINNHECMAPICGFITHIVSRNIFNFSDNVEYLKMPKWMELFHGSLNSKTNYNVKLFMIKVIVNMQAAFKPFAKSFLTPVLIFLNSHFGNYENINYVIKDILVMLIDWKSIAIPSEYNEKRLAQKLLDMLIKNGDSDHSHIWKDNFEIINMLVKAWKFCFKIPERILEISEKSQKFKVRIIVTFLSNNMEESLVLRRELLKYLVNLFDSTDEGIVLDVCKAFGLILKFLESKNDNETKKLIIRKIERLQDDKSQKNQKKCIKYIHEIHRFYPNIINDCFNRSSYSFLKLDNVNKSRYLELFLSTVSNLTKEEITIELKSVKFKDILMHKIPECQHVALKIIEKLLNILEPSNYLPLAVLIVPYSKEASVKQREIVMNICIAVQRKYSDNIADDSAVIKLKELSKQILLSGLLETNEYLQKKVLQFWTEEGNVADESIQRMLQIFEMYDPNLESTYLPILSLMMLHLVSKDPGFDKEMFGPLDKKSEFKDYPVEILHCSKDVELVSPQFTSSYLNRMSQNYSQSNLMFTDSNESKQTQSTYQYSLPPSYELANKFSDSKTGVEQIPQPSEYKKSKRLIKNAADERDSRRYEQISINRRRKELLKEKVDRKRNIIKLYRKYRIGDFPDTEIPHSSLIRPLQELVKNDQVIARNLTVEIFCSMLERMPKDQKSEFLQKLSISLTRILVETEGSKPLIATVLEIILNSYEIYISPNLIAKVSKSCGLLSLGALLLEEKMISGHTIEDSEPVAKRRKYDNRRENDEEDDWLQLANIYKSMNDFDIVRFIFGSKKFGKELQEASFAQAASKWNTARLAYEKAHDTSEGLAKDYCQESLFVCLAHLSDWNRINEHVKADLSGDLNTLLEKPMNENWLTSWILQAQIHGMLRNDYTDEFLKTLNGWVDDKDTLTQLKGLYGEEMAIFYVNQKPEFSENCLISGLDKIIEEWKHSNSLYYEQKINKYLKLRGLSDIKMYIKVIKDKNELVPNVKCLLSYWNNSVPANQDNLLLWDKHIAYRLYFIGLLRQKFEVDGLNEMRNMLNATVVKQCLNIAKVACDQCNSHFMEKFLRYSEPYFDEDVALNHEWRLAFAKYKYLCYFDSKTPEEKDKNYIVSWKLSHELLINNCVDTKLQIDVRQHISKLVIELREVVINPDSDPISKISSEDPSISKYLPPRNNEESIFAQLNDYCLNNLKACYKSAISEDKANCYLKVSKYCHSMNSEIDKGFDLSKEFIHSTLNAMSYGSIEATQYFPCLLCLEYSNNPELGIEFQSTSSKVETWMFLKWQAQLLSHIGTPISTFIVPILLRLAEMYPNSFVYAFRMTKEMNRSSITNPTVSQLTQILSKYKDLDCFLEAMKYVVQPELFLKYHVSELGPCTAVGTVAALDDLLSILYPPQGINKKISMQGDVYKVIAEFKSQIMEVASKQGREWFFQKRGILENLNLSLKKRITGTCEVPLESYSPWLHKFNGSNIEVPGQYIGDKKPMPEYHIKIVKLNSNVTILPSLRKPIKLTMLGNDGKNYNFLVKFGEDLRTDERIEQLFMLMNRIFEGDAICRQSQQLSIDTYLVIPLTGSLGLIQWIDNTKSLNEMIKSITEDEQKMKRSNITKLYIKWMENNSSGLSKEAVIKYSREEVTDKFNECKAEIEWDVMRRAFKKASSSPESFFAIRHNFITSYATMCIAQWILGIGDRNLDNTLISYTSGRVLGIDFGYSFDASIDLLPIPELMPFRLTPQILGLLKPFDENGLLKITMINVFRALKRAKDPLLACMDIFIKEPLVDWLAKQKKLQNDSQERSDVKWYPKEKIKVVMDKFNGVKPSKLTLQQLENRYHSTELCFQKYIDIVNGTDSGRQFRARSYLDDENLSIEEQVECLLDQATDPNILARTYGGWEPWI